ncbi:uncharacterized protein K02A2.6 [Nephila pilipes]|uniref:Uncharacterized protein K02A2.6 n=1 Tax=Nephila pilipes TaxID=299642 RepID=A0A8X6TGV1_NEPPI|nr:uncharacterized protein K02A2.6 [Nephila pilipes]
MKLKKWNYKDELGFKNGVVVRGERIVIPKKLRKELKVQIHLLHQGINPCLKRDRELVFPQGMSLEILQFISNCLIRIANSDKTPQEPLKWHGVPDGTMVKFGKDIFQLKDRL